MSKNTIKIKNYSDINEEYVAAGTITPGMLIELASATTVQAHSSAAGNTMRMFSVEDELQGKTIDDNYTATNQVFCWIAQRGDVVYGILKQGQNVSVGDWLVSNGDGTLKELPSYASTGEVDVEEIVGQAIEDINATSADSRIMVRIV